MCTPDACPDVATAEWDGALKVGGEAAKVIGPGWDGYGAASWRRCPRESGTRRRLRRIGERAEGSGGSRSGMDSEGREKTADGEKSGRMVREMENASGLLKMVEADEM